MILLRVSIFFLVLLLLPDGYLYQYYLRHSNHSLLKKLFWLPSIILLLVLVGFIFKWDGIDPSFGTYIVCTLCIAIPKSIFSIFHLIGRGISTIIPLLQGHRVSRLSLGANLLIATISGGYLLFGAVKGKEFFQVKEVTFESADLPESFNGYRIIQLSDMHIGSWSKTSKAIRKVVNICNELNPDVTVFTGDLVNSHADELLPFMDDLSQLKAKDGVFSIMGNHDYATYYHWESESERLANIDRLIVREKQLGWTMLMNEHRFLTRGNDSIVLAGVENSGNPPFPDYGDLDAALRNTEGKFKVLLSHDPTHWKRNVLPETDVQLMLAGHTHDMQISIFGLSLAQFIYPEHNGMYYSGNRGLYVNIGIGHVLFPIRLGAWPEITVITLQKKK